MPRPLRIGFNARTFSSPRIRGFSRYTLNLVASLPRVAPELEIHLYTDQPVAEELRPALAFARLHERRLRPHLAWEQGWLRHALRADGIDVFHSALNTGVPWGVGAPFRTVLTLHDSIAIEAMRAKPPRTLGDWRARLGFEIGTRIALGADRIVTVSEYSKSRILALHPGLAGRIRVIPNSVDSRFRPGRLEPSRRAELRLGAEYLLYVGGFEERKNVACLLDALELARARRPGLELRLVGDPAQASPELGRRLAAAPGVRAMGYLDDETVRELYWGALCAVFPSRDEGFGLPVLEGMACGAPMLVARSSSLPEVGGGAAAYFDPGSPRELAARIEELARDGGARAALGRASVARAREFAPDAVAARMVELYRELV